MLKKAITITDSTEQVCNACQKKAVVLVKSAHEENLICLECKKKEDTEEKHD